MLQSLSQHLLRKHSISLSFVLCAAVWPMCCRWMYVDGKVDLTPVPFGSTAPIKTQTQGSGSLGSIVEKAKELDEQAKAMFGVTSVRDGMKSVFGAINKK